MADQLPLKAGDPSGIDLANLRQFQSGDTLGLLYGGTGYSATGGIPDLINHLGVAKLVGGFVDPTQLGYATAAVRGAVVMGMDLSQTGDVPQVRGLWGAPIVDPTGHPGEYLKRNAGDNGWDYGPGGVGGGGSPGGAVTDVQTKTGPTTFGGGDDLQKEALTSPDAVTRLRLGNPGLTKRGVLHLRPMNGHHAVPADGDFWYSADAAPAGFFGRVGGFTTRLGVQYDGSGLLPVALTRPREWDRHRYILQSAPGESQYRHYGTSTAPSTLGSMTSYEDDSGPWILHTSDPGATAGAGFQSPSPTLCKGRWLPDLSIKIDMPSALGAGRRFVFGFWSQNPQWLDLSSGSGSWATPGILASQCKYSSFVYDFDLNTTNWLAATYDPTSVAPSTYFNTGVAAVNAIVRLRVRYTTTSAVQFWVDDTLVHVASSASYKIPTSDVNFGLYCMGVSRDGTVVTLGIQRVCLEYGT